MVRPQLHYGANQLRSYLQPINRRAMEIRKLGKNDLDIAAYIVANLIDSSDKRDTLPAPGYFEKLLTDDRIYLLAALSHGHVVGYTLAYRFPSLYTRSF